MSSMSSENTTSGDEVSVSFTPTDRPFTIHATLGAYAKTPERMSLKELSIRLAYGTLAEVISGAESDLRDAIFEAVRGCQSAGVTVPADLEAAADDADGEEWALVERDEEGK